MSRCFPFPREEYEKKARTGEVDLLKKEKQKEKKKDKEKRKDRDKREKKEKDRRDGKHRDKKDKNDKQKDKKKEKDRDKEKDRSNNSEEKKLTAHSEGQNGEKISDEKKLPGKSESHSGEKFLQKEKGRDRDRSSLSGERKIAGQFSGYNGERTSQNNQMAEDFRDSKFVQELKRRVRDEHVGTKNVLADKFMGADGRRDEGMVRLVAKTSNTPPEEKEKNKKLDAQGIREETKSGGNATVQNLGAVKARAVDGVCRPVDKDTERQLEGKEKTKDKETDDKIRDKRKDKDREKKGHGKDKDRDREKKEKEKVKLKSEHRNLEQDNLKGINKDEPVGAVDLKTPFPLKESNKGAVADENLRKRKDLEKNGFLHVNDIKPNKFARTASSHPLRTDNGRTPDSCHAPIPPTSGGQVPGSSLKVDNKERKVNGIIEAQPLPFSTTKPSAANAQAGQSEEVSIKPPHPDSKYLSQVLSVPKMDEWSDFDDQDWLFGNESQSNKPKVGFSEIDEAPQVWAEALQIESADVCALPYVIPY